MTVIYFRKTGSNKDFSGVARANANNALKTAQDEKTKKGIFRFYLVGGGVFRRFAVKREPI